MAAKVGIILSARQRKLLAGRLRRYGMKRRTAERIGCTGQHLNQIVSGAKSPSADLLVALCRDLGLGLKTSATVISGLRQSRSEKTG